MLKLKILIYPILRKTDSSLVIKELLTIFFFKESHPGDTFTDLKVHILLYNIMNSTK